MNFRIRPHGKPEQAHAVYMMLQRTDPMHQTNIIQFLQRGVIDPAHMRVIPQGPGKGAGWTKIRVILPSSHITDVDANVVLDIHDTGAADLVTIHTTARHAKI